jgi:hypothetical protein
LCRLLSFAIHISWKIFEIKCFDQNSYNRHHYSVISSVFMTIYDKNNGRGRFQMAHFNVLTGTGPEIGDPRLGKQVVGRFGGRFSTRTRTATKRAGSRFPNGQRTVQGPILQIGVRPFSGLF